MTRELLEQIRAHNKSIANTQPNMLPREELYKLYYSQWKLLEYIDELSAQIVTMQHGGDCK